MAANRKNGNSSVGSRHAEFIYVRLVFLLVLFTIQGMVYAQKAKNAPVFVVGRNLGDDDSLKIREYFFSGLKEKVSQRYDESAEYFSKILDLDPANDAALYELAKLYHAKNDEQEAELYARKAVTVNSENKWYWLLLADVYKKTNNLEQLVPVFDELIKLDPEQEDFYFDKANALYIRGKVKDAEHAYAAIEEKFGSSQELITARQRIYQKKGNPEKAASEIEKLIAADPNDLKNYFVLSEIYAKDGNNEQAMAILQKAKAIDAENPYLRLAMADQYIAQGNKEQAFSELKTAFGNSSLAIDPKVRIVLSFFPQFRDADVRSKSTELARIITEAHPSDPKSFSIYGDILFQDSKLNEAKASYKKALQLNNQVYLIWEQLIRVEISQSDFDAAIADGEEALSLFPNQAPLNLYTGIAYAQKQRNDKAVLLFENASALETENKELQSQIFASLGDAYNALKRFKESDGSYEKALALLPDNAYVLNNYAYYLSLRGEKLSTAAEMAARANKLQPGNASFEDTYAWVLFRQKKYTEARSWIEKAIKTNANSGVQFEHYGDILYYLGEKELAGKQWRMAKEKGVKSAVLERKINEKKYVE